MRYLGVDYGAKRIGLALSDPEGRIAMPFKTVTNVKTALAEIAAIVKKGGAQKIVVGLPITFSGGASEQTKAVEEFAEKLRDIVGVPVDFENELLTTKMAERSGIPRQKIDMAAAAIILQSYLDKLTND